MCRIRTGSWENAFGVGAGWAYSLKCARTVLLIFLFTAFTFLWGHPSQSLWFKSGPHSLSFKDKLMTQVWPVSFALPLDRGDGHVTQHGSRSQDFD